ncbi:MULTISPECIES: ABC transporter ATP-binding protein [Dehalogenimonas]|jgi:Fe-S cluster assembly ATP-binding protein|uniref:Iron-regulated ABC transporter ATPase subunit SufC n=2 Tax=Dehalogenimonas TaxID=670486 RepID=A0A0W0GJI5_9CHLR|nr:ABC transporter ATP-binding protein [Dehalogenimonas alkenigignens]KTB48729.1 Iron-regulated ABC transporter ATPase subunit SufC [Dehalogenimonas alkenigignens]PVV84856.1 ABC transporter ATP-binding protein [Dehalogenimonas alkenigignens]
MDSDKLLEIKNLKVAVEGKEILHGISLSIKAGETHVIYGPNGSGKTTLLMTIMGFPKYKITGGQIIFEGQDVTDATLDERARVGIGLSFQRPPIVRGVKTRDMVTACFRGREDGDTLSRLAERANMTDFLDRDINYGFSGGETKRSELLQLLAQSPDLVLLDEPESGVDLENIALIGDLINDLLEKTHPMRNRTRSGLIISHTGHILEYVNARTGYVMFEGRIICEGDPHEILETIKIKGYGECASCQICKR